MAKLFFIANDPEGFCHSRKYIIKQMRDSGIKEQRVFEAKVETGTGYFFCRHFFEVGETGSCGKVCNKYKPRNGKNGRCSYSSHVYEQTTNELTIKL